jgi:putative transposase
MLIQRSYKTELDPNNKQKTLFVKACGVRRFVWNWGLSQRIEVYKTTGKSDGDQDLRKSLGKIKDEKFPWVREVNSTVPTSALRDLDNTYKYFFRRCKNGEKPGFPKFKSKKNGLGSFRLYKIYNHHVKHNKIKLPNIGWVKLKEKGYLPTFGVKINSVTIKEKAGRWYCSLKIEENVNTEQIQGAIVAYDLGLNCFTYGSDTTQEFAPKPLKKSLRKLQKLSKQHSRKKKGSNNRKKHTKKLAKLHLHIANQRKDYLDKLTTTLAKTKSVIVVEDLNVEGMKRNHCLARSLLDVSFGTFISMLQYKTKWYGSTLFKVDQWYPSSQICSNCGMRCKEKMKLNDRTFNCEFCNLTLDRDFNASLNLLNYYIDELRCGVNPNTVRSTGINASGDDNIGCLDEGRTNQSQEIVV